MGLVLERLVTPNIPFTTLLGESGVATDARRTSVLVEVGNSADGLLFNNYDLCRRLNIYLFFHCSI